MKSTTITELHKKLKEAGGEITELGYHTKQDCHLVEYIDADGNVCVNRLTDIFYVYAYATNVEGAPPLEYPVSLADVTTYSRKMAMKMLDRLTPHFGSLEVYDVAKERVVARRTGHSGWHTTTFPLEETKGEV